MNPQHRPRGVLKMELYDRLREVFRVLDSPVRPVVEFGLQLSETDLVEPDLMRTTEPRGEGFVPLASVALVIEVSDTSLAFDLGAKARRRERLGDPPDVGAAG